MDTSDLFSLLVRQLLQVSVVAVAVWGIVRWKAHDRPHLAHALWAIVVIKCLIPPVVASPLGVFCWSELFTGTQQAASQTPPNTPVLNLAPVPSRVPLPKALSSSQDHAIRHSVTPPATKLSPALPQPMQRTPQSPETYTDIRFVSIVMIVWLAGTIIGLFTTAVRLVVFLRRARRDAIDTPDHVTALVDRLCRQLQIRRNIRVRIVRSPIGPAVVGLFRPTILLPQLLIANKSEKQLAPLLAHELIHVRRGDLYWSLFQTVAARCWWYHPLVALAARMLGHEAERSCDEETIRALGCDPAAYARGLLDILEQKQRLQVAPALPGVRPADITKKRLERIMRLEHGRDARTPRWISLVMLAGVVIAVPGTAWVVGQDGTAQPPHKIPYNAAPLNDAQRHADPWRLTAAASPAIPTSHETVTPTVLEVDAQAALERIIHEEQLTREVAEQWLQGFVSMLVPRTSDRQVAITVRDTARDESSLETKESKPQDPLSSTTDGHTIVLGGQQSWIKFLGNRMFVLAAPQYHPRVQQVLDRVARHGTRQLSVSTRIMTIPAEKFATLDLNWTIASNDKNATASLVTASQLHGTSIAGNAAVSGWAVPDTISSPAFPFEFQTATDQSPTLLSVMKRKNAEKLIADAQRDPRTNILQAPKVTVFNGQDATIIDAVQRPFVVSVADKTLAPILRTVSEGLRLNIHPICDDASCDIKLTCEVLLNEITEVNTLTFKHESSPSNGGVTLQVPQIAAQRLAVSDLAIPTDSSLLIAGVPANQGKQKMIMMALIDVDILDSRHPSQTVTAADTSPLPQAEPVTPATRENAGPDLVIKAKRSSDAAVPAELIAALQTAGFQQPLVRGDIEFTITNGNLVVRGDELTISDSEDAEEFELKGDRGEVTFAGGTSSANFVGNASFRCDDMEASADEIRNETNKWQFRGNVRLVYNEVQIEAAEITLDQDSGSIATSGQTKFKSLAK